MPNFIKIDKTVAEMIAKRQTYRHRDRDIIQTCYSIVFFDNVGVRSHIVE